MQTLLDEMQSQEADDDNQDDELNIDITRFPGWGREVETQVGPNDQIVT